MTIIANLWVLILCFSHLKRSTNTSKRQPSGNSGKKSSQLKDTSGKPGSKDMATAPRQVSYAQPQVRSQTGTSAPTARSSRKGGERMESYDSDRISQWAIQTPAGPPVVPEYGVQEHHNFGHGNDMICTTASQMPSNLCVSPSDGLHSLHPQASFGPGTTFHDPCSSNTGATFQRLGMNTEMICGPEYYFPSSLGGETYANTFEGNMNEHAYSDFAASGLQSFDPLSTHPPAILGNDPNGLTLSSPWEVSGAELTQPLDWSPVSGFTPSSSSMQSSTSFLGQPPDASVISYEGMYAGSHNGPLDGENGIIPPFSLGEVSASQSSSGYIDPERFALNMIDPGFSQSNQVPSTVKPAQNFQRTPLSMDMWTGYEATGTSYGLPVTYTGFDGSRRSSEGEAKTARDHPYYKASAKEDGLYHCPYAVTDNCTHKPEKLKCNYE